MAKRLEDLPYTFRVLHDRRIRGTRTNIDHIAIGPTGVWVIDANGISTSTTLSSPRV